MDEIREVAWAYYTRATTEEKELAEEFFNSLDVDGDRKVTISEFKNLLGSEDQLFKQLDENGDGSLDFAEVLALFYMAKAQIRSCDACRNLLLGAYFSCLLCEKDSPSTCDLCCSCYRGATFKHRHPPANFVDNRSMRLLVVEFMKHADVSQPSEQIVARDVRQSPSRSTSKRETAKEALILFSDGIKIGNAVITIGNVALEAGCCIM